MCIEYNAATIPSLRNEQGEFYDPFALFPLIDFSSNALDLYSWSSTGNIDIENHDILGELNNDYCTMDTSSAILYAAAGEHISPTPIFREPQHNLIALGSPALHRSLFIETLLNKCK